MSELVFLLEEPSAEAMLQELIQRLAPPPRNFPVRYIVFEGKSDLEKRIVHRLKHYQVPDARFIVLRDQDAGDCHQVKSGLIDKCHDAGRTNTLVRIACHELESWYLADLVAVEKGLDIKKLSKKQDNKKYRDPDKLANAAEELKKLTNGVYQKISGSRSIGPYLDINNKRSASFAVFIAGLKKILAELMVQ